MGYSVIEWIKSEKLREVEWKYKKEEIFCFEELERTKDESISPERMNVVIDYITRLLVSKNFDESFQIISRAFQILLEAKELSIGERRLKKLMREKYLDLFNEFREMDQNWEERIFYSDRFIEAAVEFTIFDSYYKTGKAGLFRENIKVTEKTIKNIRILAKRTFYFLKRRGTSIMCGSDITCTTSKVAKGYWDFLSKHDLIEIGAPRDSSEKKLN